MNLFAPTPFEIQFNGQPLQTRASSLLALLIEQRLVLAGAFACAVNQRFVPRSDWSDKPLKPGDGVDVLVPMAGG
jgi:sulfur carrier protein